MLADLLRDSRGPLLEELLDRGGYVSGDRAPAREAFDTALTDLRHAIQRGSPDIAAAGIVAELGARDYEILGSAVLGLIERSGAPCAWGDVRVVHEWVCRRIVHGIQEIAIHGEAAARSEERFRLALTNARIAVFELDRDLRLRWSYNPADPTFDEEMRGKTLDEMHVAVDDASFTAAVRGVLTSGQGARIELHTTEGDVTDLLLAVEPVLDHEGEITGVRGAATDVTALKRTQAALEQALAFRERMTTILAHDLRNPLTAIVGISRVLARREALAENDRAGLAQIETAAQRMAELVRTLLDFSAARRGDGIQVTPVPSDLSEIGRAAVEEARNTAPGRVIELDAEREVSGAWDPARLAQVVSNLVGNALTYGAKDEPVRVSVMARGDEGIIAVRNRGPIIPASAVPSLFEPFQRGAAAEGTRGLGLGLYIVKEIVSAHGGRVDVESNADAGTAFTVTLPRSPRSG